MLFVIITFSLSLSFPTLEQYGNCWALCAPLSQSSFETYFELSWNDISVINCNIIPILFNPLLPGFPWTDSMKVNLFHKWSFGYNLRPFHHQKPMVKYYQSDKKIGRWSLEFDVVIFNCSCYIHFYTPHKFVVRLKWKFCSSICYN